MFTKSVFDENTKIKISKYGTQQPPPKLRFTMRVKLERQMKLFYSCCGKAVNYETNTLQVLYSTRSVLVSNTKIKFLPLLLDPSKSLHSPKKL